MPTPDDLRAALRSIEGAKAADPARVVSRARRRRNAKLAGVSGSAVLAVGALAIFALPSLGGLVVNSSADSVQFGAGAGHPPMSESEPQTGREDSNGESPDLAAGAFNCAAKAELPQSSSIPVHLGFASLPVLPVSGNTVDFDFLIASSDESVRTVSILPTELAVVDDSNTIVGQIVPIAISGRPLEASTMELSLNAPQPLTVQFRYFQCAGVDPTAQFSFLPMLEVSTNIAEPNYSIIVGTRVLNLP